MRSIPFEGAVKKLVQYKYKKTKQIKGHKCNCGTFERGFWTLLRYWHDENCIINKKGKSK